jgi:nonsense-mediated mRNA decay protein 3
VPHKRTFYWLEQQILSSRLHLEALGIRERGDGLDFYYTALNKCKKMVDYLATLVPLRYSISKKLISYIEHTNEYSFKHTLMVELAPVCRDDLVILPKETQRKMGGCAPIMLCHKVSSSLHLIDPFTLSTLDVNAAAYFRAPFEAIASRSSLTKYAVQDVSPRAVDPSILTSSAHSPSASKFSLADVTVVRLDQLGVPDAEELHTITHLGHLLKPGDLALGIDLRHVNMIQIHAERVAAYTERVPEVLLVRKTFERKSKGRRKAKPWTLKRMTVQTAASDDEEEMPVDSADGAAAAAKDQRKRRQARRKKDKNKTGGVTEAARKADFETFLDDLEEDPDLREGVQIYKGPSLAAAAAAGLAGTAIGAPVDADAESDEELPQIPIEEMLDNMTLGD